MIGFKATILKFGTLAEKTGWFYILITRKVAEKLNPGVKKSFRVQGRVDDFEIKGKALMPMGEGEFILPLKADIRKAIRKTLGDTVTLMLQKDEAAIVLSADLLTCLSEEQEAIAFFDSLTMGHRKYFSDWIESAKTEQTKTKRIAQTVNAMVNKWDFGQMIRSQSKERKDLLGY